MASMAISSAVLPNVTQAASASRTAPIEVESTQKAPPGLQPDTVKLSPAAMAKMMHRAGQSPALIAATLGTNVAAVDGYLNIKVAAQAVSTPAPAEQAEPAAQPATQAQAVPAKVSAPAVAAALAPVAEA